MKTKMTLNKIINVIFFIIFSWIFILLIFFSDKLKYFCKQKFILKNITLLLIFFIITALVIYCYKKIKKKNIKKINYDKIVKYLIPILFVFQIYIFYHIYFIAGFDSGGLLVPSARNLVNNMEVSAPYYFTRYPNNLLLLTFFKEILKFNSTFGIFSGDYDLMSIIIINCIISQLATYLIYKICCKYFSKGIAFITYLISVILLVFSHWNVVCYSDSIGLLFPILILYIYSLDFKFEKIKNEKLKYVLQNIKILIIPILAYLGYNIKPQTIIVFISIVIVELIKNISKLNKKTLKLKIPLLLISIIIIILLNINLKKVYTDEGIKFDKNQEFGITHYLMMGVNKKTNGVFSDEDVRISSSQKTQEKRIKKNISVFKKRIKNYGTIGYFDLLSKKMLTNYNDGTFAWGKEGDFFYVKMPVISRMGHILRNIYYTSGRFYRIYSTFLQFIWISMLLIIMVNSIYELKNNSDDNIYIVLILTIIGITIFELLFEARARYLYSNLPIYIITMSYGLKNIKNGVEKYEKR